MEEEFNPEEMGIPYDEPAKIKANNDIEDFLKSERLKEANVIYDDLIELFQSDKKREYLYRFISIESLTIILCSIEEIFVEFEEYEKCAKINAFKKLIIKS